MRLSNFCVTVIPFAEMQATLAKGGCGDLFVGTDEADLYV